MWKKTSKTKTNESDGNELDRSRHRCKSVNSLLSLENSFITKDDENNIISVIPAVCVFPNASLSNTMLIADTTTSGTDNTAGGDDEGDITVNSNNRNYYNNRAINRSYDYDNDSGNNIGLNVDHDDNDNDNDDDDEVKELEDFQGKWILINDGAKNGDKAKGNGEEVEQKKKNGTATATKPELLLLKGQIPPLHITPPITSKPIISSILS
ncbi:MAG: hypothetical protein ACI8RD_007378 [Bacillariaceae sp.]|jgi:hypothetical protein